MSLLGAFNTQLTRFFEELAETYPEERDIRLALEAIQGAKKVNPKLVLDLFYEHVYLGAHEMIEREDEEMVLEYAQEKMRNQFNHMSVALMIYQKYYPAMTEANQSTFWAYLKVLCKLCERAKASRVPF